jgi:hypothetical protein
MMALKEIAFIAVPIAISFTGPFLGGFISRKCAAEKNEMIKTIHAGSLIALLLECAVLLFAANAPLYIKIPAYMLFIFAIQIFAGTKSWGSAAIAMAFLIEICFVVLFLSGIASAAATPFLASAAFVSMALSSGEKKFQANE